MQNNIRHKASMVGAFAALLSLSQPLIPAVNGATETSTNSATSPVVPPPYHAYAEYTEVMKFPITLTTSIAGAESSDGDQVSATLNDDLKLGSFMLAPAGSVVQGHIESVTPSKFRRRSSMVVLFDKIVTPSKKEIRIEGFLPDQIAIFNNNGHLRRITIGTQGTILRTESLDMREILPDFGFNLPESMLSVKGRLQINLLEGDEVTLKASVRTEDIDTTIFSPVKGTPLKLESAQKPAPATH